MLFSKEIDTGTDLAGDIRNGIYFIRNLSSATINPPISTPAACILISSGICHLLVGVDVPLMYGRYYKNNWVNLLS